MVGALLLWLAQPPAGLWPLAYAGAGCWLWLASQREVWSWRESLRFWLGGVLYWLLAVHWVRLPCWPLTGIGWPLLAMYLAVYPLATVLLTRLAIRRWRTPLWLAGPVAWTALELVQARLFTGFLMGAVSHSHAGQPWLRSLAAYTGAYGVTFAVVLVAAAGVSLLQGWRGPARGRAVATLVASVAVVCGLGLATRSGVVIETPGGRRPTVALVQGDIRATWNPDPKRNQTIMDRQVALSAEAFEKTKRVGKPLDLVVWPESMFRAPLFSFDGEAATADGVRRGVASAYEESIGITAAWFKRITGMLGETPLLVGIDHFDLPTDPEAPASAQSLYNSAALVDGRGELIGVYDKSHLVPFGEYIPFARDLPALYYLTPMASGLRAGPGPVAMRVPIEGGKTLRVCPSICYETVIPHVIRRQVAELTDRGDRPDVLVNVTNDAWFWGASELDMHLAVGAFRAIENGLPLLVVANGGLSAFVDATGEVRSVTERQREQVLIDEVPPRSSEPTFYTRYGDWFAGACLLACVGLVVDALRAGWLSRGAVDTGGKSPAE